MSRPVLKVGIVGDIQGYPVEYDWGMHNLERAFAMLAPKQPDVLIMDGDLSDQGDPEAFYYFRNGDLSGGIIRQYRKTPGP